VLYQYWCDSCFVPYEIVMNLSEKDRYDTLKLTKKEKLKFQCPECKEELTYLIAPPKIIKIN
jgi:hypothetical protein